MNIPNAVARLRAAAAEDARTLREIEPVCKRCGYREPEPLADWLSRRLEPRLGVCHRCGCTDLDPCEPPCHWVEAHLCSACIEGDEPALRAVGEEE